ncbi:hypothetical protein LCGC14_1207610 [marine sediment metagenome]|uniref:Asparagine synthetase domain-containing protein n=1 Tax=marine sediment metagenome TaxID=412755 RepID=A0A0F9LJG5_9ZZZZ
MARRWYAGNALLVMRAGEIMIVYPKNWNEIGQEIPTKNIEKAIISSLEDIDVNNITLSGGVDSSLLLHYMSDMFDEVNAYTIGSSMDHPDVVYAQQAASQFDNVNHKIYIVEEEEIKKEEKPSDLKGDAAVRLLYKHIKKDGVDNIVAGDGIDEFTAGYYAHQKEPDNYKLYYDFIRKLQSEQLEPLNKNTSGVNVHLPYLDSRIILLLAQIPLEKKVDKNNRKKIIYSLAKGKVPKGIIERRKYGFCDALSGIVEGNGGKKSKKKLENGEPENTGDWWESEYYSRKYNPVRHSDENEVDDGT